MRRRNKRILYVVFVSFVAALGGFLFGYDLVMISGAVIFLKEEYGLSAAGLGFTTASAVIGCIVGPIAGSRLCDLLGRKRTLITANILFGISAIGTALPETIDQFNFFRVIGGIGCGLASVASPMYLAEIAPAHQRGRLVMIYQLAIVVGAFSATLVAYYLAFFEAWRWMFASELVPILAFGVLLTLIPRSPRWLAQQNRYQEARRVLARINGREKAEGLLQEIQESLAEETGTLSELLKPGIRTAFAVAVLLAVFSQCTGWSFIASYLPILLQKAGFEEASDAIFQYAMVNGINIGLTLVSMWLVDRVGRRPIWLVTSLGMIFGVTLLGAVFHFDLTGFVVVGAVLMCAWPHVVGLGPLPWVMMSEVLPTRVRARAVSIATMCLWIANYSGVHAFPVLLELSEERFGSPAAVFWIFTLTCALAYLRLEIGARDQRQEPGENRAGLAAFRASLTACGKGRHGIRPSLHPGGL